MKEDRIMITVPYGLVSEVASKIYILMVILIHG